MPELDRFRALVVSRDENKVRAIDLVEMQPDELMDGDVTVRLWYSTLNYKDGLAITGKLPVVRRWPMIPGIDFAGVVTSSRHADFAPGDEVVLNGWGVGEVHYGGFAGMARVNGDFLIRRPESLSAFEAMAIGTAGYTAMLCLMALEQHGLSPAGGPVLVTGAAGGVGSVAVILLARHGYHVIASTGRPHEHDYLRGLGAQEIVERIELSNSVPILSKEKWAAAIDTVGSYILANVLAMTREGGAVAACGNAAGMDLPASVAPFILRGVSLLGVNSVTAPKALREEAWSRLAGELDRRKLAAITTTISLDEVVQAASGIVEGRVRGRIVVSLT